MSVKIIAEVGSNWSTFEEAKNSVALAKQCGADAVKYQLYDHKALYGLRGNRDEGFTDIFLPGTLPLEWLPKLKEKADACGIEFMCSAFSPELLNAVEPFVTTHKVASSELTHVRMLERLRAIGKPVILSTGASGKVDIMNALGILGNTPVTLLYCVSAYPARFVNLSRIPQLRAEFGRAVGFSDHTTDIAVIPKAAADLGATVIEKHVNFVGATGPDAPHSLSTDEFKAMVQILRGQPVAYSEERDMFLKHNRRLIATRDIQPGEVLKEGENFGIYRSLKPDDKAFSPFLIDMVSGQAARSAIKAGEGIGPDVI